MGEQFTLRPGLFGGPVTVIVEAHGVRTVHGGKSRQIAFKDVEGVYSWFNGFGAILSFVGKRGEKVVFSGASIPFMPNRDGGMLTYFQASSAALKTYAAACPGAHVHVGQSLNDNRRTMAIVLLVVIAVAVANALQDGQIEPAEYLAFPIMFAAVGYVAMTRFNVLKPPPRRPADVEAAEFAQAADEIVPR